MSRSDTAEPPSLITKTEACRLLGISRDSLYRMLRAGSLSEVRLAEGMRTRLRREDVLELVRRGSP